MKKVEYPSLFSKGDDSVSLFPNSITKMIGHYDKMLKESGGKEHSSLYLLLNNLESWKEFFIDYVDTRFSPFREKLGMNIDIAKIEKIIRGDFFKVLGNAPASLVKVGLSANNLNGDENSSSEDEQEVFSIFTIREAYWWYICKQMGSYFLDLNANKENVNISKQQLLIVNYHVCRILRRMNEESSKPRPGNRERRVAKFSLNLKVRILKSDDRIYYWIYIPLLNEVNATRLQNNLNYCLSGGDADNELVKVDNLVGLKESAFYSQAYTILVDYEKFNAYLADAELPVSSAASINPN